MLCIDFRNNIFFWERCGRYTIFSVVFPHWREEGKKNQLLHKKPKSIHFVIKLHLCNWPMNIAVITVIMIVRSTCKPNQAYTKQWRLAFGVAHLVACVTFFCVVIWCLGIKRISFFSLSNNNYSALAGEKNSYSNLILMKTGRKSLV